MFEVYNFDVLFTKWNKERSQCPTIFEENGWLIPNVYIAHKVLLTLSITVLYADRSFFKLKLKKTYLRLTILHERDCY